MNLLHLDSSILGANSVSRSLSAAVVQRLKTSNTALRVSYCDLAAEPIPQLSGAYLAALSGAGSPHSEALQHDLSTSSAILEQFLASDIVVIGVAFYNFTIASQLKTWIDRVVVAGKMFRYTEKGVEGLAGSKRLILAISRGGVYGPGSPAQPYEYAESYLRAVFGSLGIIKPEVVIAEGIARGPEKRESAVKAALAEIALLPVAA